MVRHRHVGWRFTPEQAEHAGAQPLQASPVEVERIEVGQNDDAPAALLVQHHVGVEVGVGALVTHHRYPGQGSGFPAHAVEDVSVAFADRGLVHRRDPLRGKHRRGIVGSAVELADEEVGDVLGAGDEVAARHGGPRIGRVERPGESEPGSVPGGQTGSACVGLVGERVAHPQRSEDPFTDAGLVGLSADRLHDQPENVVVSVGVLEHLTGTRFDFGVAQGRHPLTERVVAHVVAEHGLVRGVSPADRSCG